MYSIIEDEMEKLLVTIVINLVEATVWMEGFLSSRLTSYLSLYVICNLYFNECLTKLSHVLWTQESVQMSMNVFFQTCGKFQKFFHRLKTLKNH